VGFLQYSPKRHHWFLLFASTIIIFNLIDAALTLAVVHSGAAGEANPLMASALAWGSVWFMVVKLGLVSLCVMLLWRLRHRRTAGFALLASATGYTVLLLVVHTRSVTTIAQL
jgi:hypothetical protein